ncbi:MAG: hypothetical protein ACUVXI_05600 [bacterium]
MEAAVFREISEIEASPLAKGVERIVLPGQLEYEKEQERRRDGSP